MCLVEALVKQLRESKDISAEVRSSGIEYTEGYACARVRALSMSTGQKGRGL